MNNKKTAYAKKCYYIGKEYKEKQIKISRKFHSLDELLNKD